MIDIVILSGILVLYLRHPDLASERLFREVRNDHDSKRANVSILFKRSQLSLGLFLFILMIKGYICNSE
jgi:hypothetical protein